MRGTTAAMQRKYKKPRKFAKDNNVDLRTIELDVASQESADATCRALSGNEGVQAAVRNCCKRTKA
jgi:hypothetical protein